MPKSKLFLGRTTPANFGVFKLPTLIELPNEPTKKDLTFHVTQMAILIFSLEKAHNPQELQSVMKEGRERGSLSVRRPIYHTEECDASCNDDCEESSEAILPIQTTTTTQHTPSSSPPTTSQQDSSSLPLNDVIISVDPPIDEIGVIPTEEEMPQTVVERMECDVDDVDQPPATNDYFESLLAVSVNSRDSLDLLNLEDLQFPEVQTTMKVFSIICQLISQGSSGNSKVNTLAEILKLRLDSLRNKNFDITNLEEELVGSANRCEDEPTEKLVELSEAFIQYASDENKDNVRQKIRRILNYDQISNEELDRIIHNSGIGEAASETQNCANFDVNSPVSSLLTTGKVAIPEELSKEEQATIRSYRKVFDEMKSLEHTGKPTPSNILIGGIRFSYQTLFWENTNNWEMAPFINKNLLLMIDYTNEDKIGDFEKIFPYPAMTMVDSFGADTIDLKKMLNFKRTFLPIFIGDGKF